jgi:hypothetical protein
MTKIVQSMAPTSLPELCAPDFNIQSNTSFDVRPLMTGCSLQQDLRLLLIEITLHYVCLGLSFHIIAFGLFKGDFAGFVANGSSRTSGRVRSIGSRIERLFLPMNNWPPCLLSLDSAAMNIWAQPLNPWTHPPKRGLLCLHMEEIQDALLSSSTGCGSVVRNYVDISGFHLL